jgi:hypothetical protein
MHPQKNHLLKKKQKQNKTKIKKNNKKKRKKKKPNNKQKCVTISVYHDIFRHCCYWYHFFKLYVYTKKPMDFRYKGPTI